MDLFFTIQNIGAMGDGIINISGKEYFVPFVLSGEKVKINKVIKDRVINYDIIEKSNVRAEPICPLFTKCGGCRLQHFNSQVYNNYKKNTLLKTLKKLDLSNVVIDEIVNIGISSRRRVIFQVQQGAIGFCREKSHDLIKVEKCPLIRTELNNFISELKLSSFTGEMTLTLTDNGIDMSLKSKKNPILSDIENLAALVNSNKVIKIEWNDEPIAQILKPSIKIGDYYVEFPSGSFLQPSKEGQDVLTSLVCNFISGYNLVADLFCGLGTFTIPLSTHNKKVYGFESFSPAVNALNHSGCQKVSGEVKDLFKDYLTVSELDKYEALVLDPPRLGAYNQVKELSKTSKVEKIAYVSCNPATFSRDAEVLINGGFVLKQISPVDQFIYSHHLELVALFQKA